MVFENPEKFGFEFVKKDLYQPYQFRSVVVENSIPDLAQFAIDNGTNYKMLKVVNPWLISSSLTISQGNSYTIKIPTSYVDEAYYPSDYDEEDEEELLDENYDE
jgi:hypothetical protein